MIFLFSQTMIEIDASKFEIRFWNTPIFEGDISTFTQALNIMKATEAGLLNDVEL